MHGCVFYISLYAIHTDSPSFQFREWLDGPMNILKELPDGAIWPHLLDAIQHAALEEVRRYAASRRENVERGSETRCLAALLVEKYGEGIVKAFEIAGIDSTLRSEIDRVVRELDPEFERNRQFRWAARPAGISIVPAPRKQP